jgi:hypothetical protein
MKFIFHGFSRDRHSDKVWSDWTVYGWIEQCPVSPDNVRLGVSVPVYPWFNSFRF